MIKIIPPDSYDFGEEAARLIKYSAFGLRGNDLSAFVKRAGHELADAVRKMAFASGEVPVHLIAMGSTEKFSCNRNGDGFRDASLQKYHNTFEKYAKIYRNHANRDRSKSYGIIKKSFYNPEMGRVELIAALNATKEAADRNDGLTADTELEKLASGKDLPVSMSCRVKYDVCSGCGNKAANRQEYCDSAMCKYGGLKHHIGRICEDGHQLHADNPEPQFFDLSSVFRPADRTAYVLGKVASGGVVGGAELAEILGVTAPDYLLADSGLALPVNMLDRVKLARAQAAREESLPQSDWEMAFDASVYPWVLNLDTTTNKMAALKTLGQEKIALSLPEWLQLTTGEHHLDCVKCAEAVKPILPAAYRLLIEDPDFPDILKSAVILPSVVADKSFLKASKEEIESKSVDAAPVQKRVWQAAIKKLTEPKEIKVKVKVKTAADVSPAAKEIAKRYAAYQVEFLHNLERNSNFPLTCELLIHQNRT